MYAKSLNDTSKEINSRGERAMSTERTTRHARSARE